MIEHFAFRYRDPRTGKWTRARYKAAREQIATRYAEWETIGPPEIITPGEWGGFRPLGPLVTHAELARLEDRAPDLRPTLSDGERELVALFLRRLVTYYARQRRFAQMEGAARLHQRVTPSRQCPGTNLGQRDR